MQLFNSMSSPSFLLANETNHSLLRSLLEAINAIAEHQYSSMSSARLDICHASADSATENSQFIFAILRNRKRFEALRSFTLESGQEEIERRNRRRKDSGASHDPSELNSTRSSVESIRSPTGHLSRTPTLGNVPEDGTFAIGDDEDDSDDEERPTPAASSPSERPSRASSVASPADDDVPRQLQGMSEKARGKMPAGAASFSRQNSTTSLGSGVPSQSQPGVFEPSAQWIESWLLELPLHTSLTIIQQLSVLIPRQAISAETPMPATLSKIREVQLVGVEPSPIRVHSFEWSPLALGWYESLLWGFIFASEMQISKGTVGVWNTTHIKLFRVQETAPQGPTLTSPRGAVDAVGSNIVSRIGAINLRGAPPSVLGSGAGNGQPAARGG